MKRKLSVFSIQYSVILLMMLLAGFAAAQTTPLHDLRISGANTLLTGSSLTINSGGTLTITGTGTATTQAASDSSTKLATTAFVKAAQGVFNVKAYGATGNARHVDDAVTVNGDQTVTSATGNFTSADVGKVVWGTIFDTSVVPIGTVTAINSSTSIEVSVAATSSQSSVGLVIGTNDTTAIQSAVTAMTAAGGGTLHFPSGGYLISAGLGMSTSVGNVLLGDGHETTRLYLSPSLNLDALTAADGPFEGADRVQGVTVDGNYYPFTSSGPHQVIKAEARDVTITRTRGFGVLLGTYQTQTVNWGVHVEHSSGIGILVAASRSEFHGCYSGNNDQQSVYISNGVGTDDTGAGISWTGGVIDESTTGALYIDNCVKSELHFSNTVVLGGTGTYAVNITTSGDVVHFDNCTLINYTTGNRGGLQVAGGATAYLSNCRVKGSGTLYAINNSGTVVDSGGNSIEGTGLTGSAMTYGGSVNLPIARFNSGTGATSSTFWRGDGTWAAAGAGTVTSVAQSFTGGLISVGGSPITSSGTLALTVAGTSGGIPYFSSSSTWASSGALAANALVIGGGAGVAPSTTTTGTGVLTAIGNAVDAASGLLTYGIVGTSGTKLPLLNTANTWSAAQTNSTNGALSTPAMTYTGTWITGGSATTTKPLFFIEPSGTTSTGWSTSGTGLGVNAASGFAGNIIDAQIAGASKMKVYDSGTVTYLQLSSTAANPIIKGNGGLNVGSSLDSVYFCQGLWGVNAGTGILSTSNSYAIQWGSGDLSISRDAAAVLQLGVDANADATDQTIKAADGITGTDRSGGDLTLKSGDSTGSGTSAIIFSTPITGGGTGTTTRSAAERVKITGGGLIVGSGTAISKIKHGTATLSSGAATVSDSDVVAGSRIFVNRQADGGTVGDSFSIVITAATNFTITSKTANTTQTLDTSTVSWTMINP